MGVTAIVPAYNEEATVGRVIEALLDCPAVDDVLVVSDGSTDRTAEVARCYPVRVLELPENRGKGGAMKAGVENTTNDVVVFIDADLVGLKPEHIANLIEPVRSGRADMSVGLFEDGRFATDLAQKIAPFLSGQRAVRRSLFQEIPQLEHTRYGIEVALSRYADRHEIPVEIVHLHDLSQVMKEEKRGVVKGLCARMRMYWEIMKWARY
ncbi:MAG: glycosyltransferase family 2 protein [Firmicutes bacterium]|jgi:glycosyltransferase involved in cell wall biosynthesis|nr:glycosyltransferase family 2 protein [Bacillota bacterium]